jgi:diacylglycerol kinase family enzyme
VRVLLIVNPTASATTPARRRVVEDRLAGEHDLSVAETEWRGHATTLAADAAAAGAHAVLVLGGDGTLNEAANGLVGSDTALGPLPGGALNVLARTLGYRNHLTTATNQLLAALAHGSRRRVTVGLANGRRFLVVLGVGFDAAVISRAEHLSQRAPRLKRRLVPSLFVLTALGTLAGGYPRRAPDFSVQLDGRPIGTGRFAIVSNTTPYAFLGPRPFVVTRGAGLDHALALTVFTRLRLTGMARAALEALTRGITPTSDVIQRADAHDITITTRPPGIPWHVDGDYLGLVDELVITCEPDRLTLVVPCT